MERKWIIALVLLFPLVLFKCGLAEAKSKVMGAELDSCVSGSVNEGMFSGSVLVAVNGRVVLSKGYGWADKAKGIRNTQHTRFQIGSVTKQFTTAAVMRLREDGKLRDDDRVSSIIPDYPGGSRITLWQLMTHSSGIPEYLGLPGAWAATAKATTPDKLIDSFKHYPLGFEPGSRFSYSNSGYLLLGAIIEKRSGMGYGDYLAKVFLKPLGMGDTSYEPNDARRGNDATTISS